MPRRVLQRRTACTPGAGIADQRHGATVTPRENVEGEESLARRGAPGHISLEHNGSARLRAACLGVGIRLSWHRLRLEIR